MWQAVPCATLQQKGGKRFYILLLNISCACLFKEKNVKGFEETKQISSLFVLHLFQFNFKWYLGRGESDKDDETDKREEEKKEEEKQEEEE